MPVIWLIDAYRAGERGQVRALADALGWPCEIKVLKYRKRVWLPHVLGQSTLRGLQAESAASLQGPWPDLVISCAVRNEPVCRWIREQSGGKTRYVHVGRPWGPLAGFDLVVTTPQYRVPEAANVVQNILTLHQVNEQRLAQSAQRYHDLFADLPKPHIALIVGGNSGPFTLGRKAALRLAREASAAARACGGSLLVTGSSRTPPMATSVLRESIDVPHYFYEWQAGDSDNPYMGILAAADRLIVTADSIAMLSEACATGKPVSMFDLGGMRPERPVAGDFRLGGTLYSVLLRWLWRPLSRDISEVHKLLIEGGRTAWLGDEQEPARAMDLSDMERAVVAVQALFGETRLAVPVQQPGTAVH
jgi:mitochondrial fission protein ELM1